MRFWERVELGGSGRLKEKKLFINVFVFSCMSLEFRLDGWSCGTCTGRPRRAVFSVIIVNPSVTLVSFFEIAFPQ